MPVRISRENAEATSDAANSLITSVPRYWVMNASMAALPGSFTTVGTTELASR